MVIAAAISGPSSPIGSSPPPSALSCCDADDEDGLELPGAHREVGVGQRTRTAGAGVLVVEHGETVEPHVLADPLRDQRAGVRVAGEHGLHRGAVDAGVTQGGDTRVDR